MRSLVGFVAVVGSGRVREGHLLEHGAVRLVRAAQRVRRDVVRRDELELLERARGVGVAHAPAPPAAPQHEDHVPLQRGVEPPVRAAGVHERKRGVGPREDRCEVGHVARGERAAEGAV